MSTGCAAPVAGCWQGAQGTPHSLPAALQGPPSTHWQPTKCNKSTRLSVQGSTPSANTHPSCWRLLPDGIYPGVQQLVTNTSVGPETSVIDHIFLNGLGAREYTSSSNSGPWIPHCDILVYFSSFWHFSSFCSANTSHGDCWGEQVPPTHSP